jgi:hypothetical protein
VIGIAVISRLLSSAEWRSALAVAFSAATIKRAHFGRVAAVFASLTPRESRRKQGALDYYIGGLTLALNDVLGRFPSRVAIQTSGPQAEACATTRTHGPDIEGDDKLTRNAPAKIPKRLHRDIVDAWACAAYQLHRERAVHRSWRAGQNKLRTLP